MGARLNSSPQSDADHIIEYQTYRTSDPLNVRPPEYNVNINNKRKEQKMFTYLITLTNGQTLRVETAGDPTIHPSFFGRVANVETLGQSDKLLSLV